MLETFSQHIMKTLADILDGGASHAALILAGGGPTVDRQAMKKSILQCAISIRAAGFQPGDVISMAYANTLDFVVAFLGVIAARCVAAPLNAAYKEEEFSFYLEDTSSKLLLLPKEGNKAAEAAAKKHKCPVATLCVSFSPDVNQPQLSITPLSPGLVMHQVPLSATSGLSDPPRPSDLALFFHTSGTTGRPKAVPLTHGNIMASLGNISLTYELFPADRSYLVMPLFHVHGLMAGLLSPLMAGASVILPSEGRFAAGSFWRDCSQHKATFFTAVPTMHQILLSRAAQDYPASNPPPLRFIRSCSASLAAATLEKLEATFKVPVLEAYAMSEASHQMTSNPLPKNGPRKPGSVGKAQGSVKVTVLDEKNRPVAVGKVGEVCIRGPNVTQGYWNNPKANAEAYAGGWFHTGK
jgi:acyl-CoA synthetase (AMP-forming)/AMP-acid ligase II